MIKPKALRQLAVCGVSLPALATSPAVATATVYMPSQVAARVLGGRPTVAPDDVAEQESSHQSHAA